MRVKLKPFAVERRVISRKGRLRCQDAVDGYSDRVEREFAVSKASKCPSVDIGLIADDVARLLRGRESFPRDFWQEAR